MNLFYSIPRRKGICLQRHWEGKKKLVVRDGIVRRRRRFNPLKTSSYSDRRTKARIDLNSTEVKCGLGLFEIYIDSEPAK